MTQYTVLIAACSIPNVIFPTVAGILADKYGKRYVFMSSLFVLLIGNCIAALACYLTNYWLILLGSFLFSIGSQCYIVVANSVEAIWFKNKETAVALSIDAGVSYLAVAGVYWVVPYIYDYGGSLFWPFAFSSATSILSIVFAIPLWLFDKTERQDPDEINKEIPALGLGTIKSLGSHYFIVLAAYCCRALAYSLFEFISSGFFQDRFNFDDNTAGRIISIPYVAFFVLMPPVGILIYNVGYKPLFCILKHNIRLL